MPDKIEVSDIADSLRQRIREVEEKLKEHKSLSDELERLQGALRRLEGVMRPRATAGHRGRRSATHRKRAAARRETQAAKSTNTRAPRGQNKAKILESLRDGPKTASEIAKEHPGMSTGTVGSTLTKMERPAR